MDRWLILMHDDAPDPEDGAAWGPYLGRLAEAGALLGGSSLGPATLVRSGPAAADGASPVVGYLLLQADSVDQVGAHLDGNPVLVAGGTVEVRRLVPD